MEDDLFSEIDLGDDQEDLLDDSLDSLVGPNGKFKSIEDLAKAKKEADRFIERLKAENADYRQKVGSSATLESVMAQVKQMVTSNNKEPEQVNQHLENQNLANIDDSKLKSLVADMLKQTAFEQKVQTNREAVQSALTASWGTEATVQLNKKSRELGIPLVHLKAIADENPNAFLRLVGIGSANSANPTVKQSSVVTVNSQVDASGAKPKSFYDKLKVTDPKAYFAKDTQAKMMNDAVKLRESFFDA